MKMFVKVIQFMNLFHSKSPLFSKSNNDSRSSLYITIESMHLTLNPIILGHLNMAEWGKPWLLSKAHFMTCSNINASNFQSPVDFNLVWLEKISPCLCMM